MKLFSYMYVCVCVHIYVYSFSVGHDLEVETASFHHKVAMARCCLHHSPYGPSNHKTALLKKKHGDACLK